MQVTRSLLVMVGLLMAGGMGMADTITYTETAIGSGQVGTTPFTNSLVTLTATGDTSAIYEFSNSPLTYDIPATVTFSVANGPSGTFTESGYAFTNSDGIAGIGVELDLMSTESSVFNTYKLSDPLAEITAIGGEATQQQPLDTTAGLFQLNEQINIPVTFSAVVTPAAATPEPSSLALLGGGFLGLAGLAGRRRLMSGVELRLRR